MKILTVRNGVEPFERDSKHSNPNSNEIQNIRMEIRTIRKGFEASNSKFKPFERDLKHSNVNSNHSNGAKNIRMQILTIRKGFEAFKSKF